MRYLIRIMCLQLLLALVFAGPVLAADVAGPVHEQETAMHDDDLTGEGEHEGEAGEHGEEHSSGGLPQLDPTWYPSQIFWLSLTFIGLYIIFGRKVLPVLSSTLENRREHIQGNLDTAEQLKEDAEKVHEAYEEILEEARAKSSALFSEVESQIKAGAAHKLDALRNNATMQTQDLEKRIAKAQKEAMDDMTTIAAEIASKAAEKIVGISTDLDQAKSVVQSINKKAA